MRRVLAAAAVVVALAGCAQKSHGFQDSPVNTHLTDNSPAQIINMPNRFANIAEKCDHHGHRVYSTTRDGSALTVIADPSCPSDWPVK
jgi:hypothetical protein